MFWKKAVHEILITLKIWKTALNVGKIREKELRRSSFFKVADKELATLLTKELIYSFFFKCLSRFQNTSECAEVNITFVKSIKQLLIRCTYLFLWSTILEEIIWENVANLPPTERNVVYLSFWDFLGAAYYSQIF